jgi:hypothetical protein
MVDSAQLTPNSTSAYQNGYGYQAVSVAILAFTGLRSRRSSRWLYPIVPRSWSCRHGRSHRELTGSSRIASLATLLLLLVPEYLFAVFRASHERLDRAFLFTAIWLLVRGAIRFRGDPVLFAAHLGVVPPGVLRADRDQRVCSGISFVLSILIALAISWLARRGPVSVRDHAIVVTRLLRWVRAAMIALVVSLSCSSIRPSACCCGS